MIHAQAESSVRIERSHRYDVAILGTGMAGSMLGAVLAKHGAKVLLIDNASHPRFAVGESTVPLTSRMMVTIANRYGIPEVKHLATFKGIHTHVTTACGVKRNFGFVLHHMDGTQHADETTQVVIPGALADHETHLFRQDVDAYMLHVAVKYGAKVRQQLSVTDVDITDKGVALRTATGEEFSASYLVDGGGFRSPLAQKFDLRENPSRLKHHARSIFTHMIDVKRYDDCIRPKGAHGNPSPWAEGTLHHMFEGGWIWVIPFDNHKDATNPLCSVGVTYDYRKYPKNDRTAEEEFFWFVNKFPTVRDQFRSARATREWVGTDRLQFSTRRVVGDRYCLMAHAAGFIDPLFSRGLANTSDVVNALAHRLLTAIREDDFSTERFEYLDRLQQNLLDYNDQLVNCAYIAFSHFNLWNAWFRVWALGQGLGELRVLWENLKFDETGDASIFDRMEEVPYPGLLFPIMEDYKTIWDEGARRIEAVGEGRLDAEEAAQQIWALLAKYFSDPMFMGAHQPSRRHISVDPVAGIKGLGSLLFQPKTEFKTFLTTGLGLMSRRWVSGRRL